MSIIKTKAAAAAEPTATNEPFLGPEEVLEQLRALRARIPEFVQLPKTRVTDQLRRRARVNLEFAREAFSSVGVSPAVQGAIGNTPDQLHEADDELARWTAVESELDAMHSGVAAANVVRRQRIGHVALQAYNVSRQLVKQEDHAQLLPYVERMRRLPKYARRRKPAEPQPQKPVPEVVPEPQKKPA